MQVHIGIWNLLIIFSHILRTEGPTCRPLHFIAPDFSVFNISTSFKLQIKEIFIK